MPPVWPNGVLSIGVAPGAARQSLRRGQVSDMRHITLWSWVPGHMVGATTTVAFNGRQSRCVQGTTGWRNAGGKTISGTQSSVRASTSNVAKTATTLFMTLETSKKKIKNFIDSYIALLIVTLLLNPQTGAFS